MISNNTGEKASRLSASQAEAAIAARKRSLDLQSAMAILGMAVVSLFFTVDMADHAKTIAGLTNILPWFLGLSVVIVAFNRWTLSLNAKALRQAAASAPRKA